jgi:hypothetical protein
MSSKTSIILAVIVLVVIAAAFYFYSSSSGNTSGNCKTSSDCNAGQVCTAGKCVPAPAGCSPACTADQQCVAGKCVTTPVGGDCVINSDCQPEQSCIAGKCATLTTCSSDSTCGPGQICSSNLCTDAQVLATTKCTDNTDCTSGYCHSSIGQCVAFPSCNVDRDCPTTPWQVCNAGTCELAPTTVVNTYQVPRWISILESDQSTLQSSLTSSQTWPSSNPCSGNPYDDDALSTWLVWSGCVGSTDNDNLINNGGGACVNSVTNTPPDKTSCLYVTS